VTEHIGHLVPRDRLGVGGGACSSRAPRGGSPPRSLHSKSPEGGVGSSIRAVSCVPHPLGQQNRRSQARCWSPVAGSRRRSAASHAGHNHRRGQGRDLPQHRSRRRALAPDLLDSYCWPVGRVHKNIGEIYW